MEYRSKYEVQFAIPEKILKPHYSKHFDSSHCNDDKLMDKDAEKYDRTQNPTLISANLPKVLDWLHQQPYPGPLEREPCPVPLLLIDKEFSTEKIVFHYDGTPDSARIIKEFLDFFGPEIKNSKSIIISPCFTPKSKLKEEQEIIHAVTGHTAETSFIKFNFTRIGDFWSYSVKHECTLLVTTKNYQADLAKVLFHFYKGGMWYNRLSFYLSP